jgi:hypothetical protein
MLASLVACLEEGGGSRWSPRRPPLPPPCHLREAAAPLPKAGKCSRHQIRLLNTAVPWPLSRLCPPTYARAPPREPSAHQPRPPPHVYASSPAASASSCPTPPSHTKGRKKGGAPLPPSSLAPRVEPRDHLWQRCGREATAWLWLLWLRGHPESPAPERLGPFL